MRFTDVIISCCCAGFLAGAALAQDVTQGTLLRKDRNGQTVAECPLKNTSVKAEISGMMARVNVVQSFENPFHDPIEAVYVFPLPHDAAVDAMTMTIGSRVVQGKIKTREEARSLYDQARQAGNAAALLDQERPNIFRQSVANIAPGDNVRISISYVQVLPYQEGGYEFVFPMVVGPRYIPAGHDGSRIKPPVAPEGTRAGHTVAIELTIDAGLQITRVTSKTHGIDWQPRSSTQSQVRLRDEALIPNKDFVLRYEVVGQAIQDTVLAHRSRRGGFFTLILQPPPRVGSADATPKELIFVLDTSGSMYGFPIEKAIESMRLALDGLYPSDTFNLITFSGDTEILFPQPVSGTAENVAIAKLFLESRSGRGGTEMMKAIRVALEPSVETGRVRIVCFMTDGYVGNDMEIIGEVQKHPDARVFAFGIGQAVNRFLLDGMTRYGRGEVEYVGLQDDGSAAARRFHERVRNPLMTDLSIDWRGMAVSDIYPKRIPDLFGAKPVVVTGRYAGPLRGTIRMRGKSGVMESARDISLDLPAAESTHDVLATLWARNAIEDMMSQHYPADPQGFVRPEIEKRITQLGLDFGLTTQFTSFVAVEEKVVNTNGKARRIDVPVDIPEGVNYKTTVPNGSGGGVASGAGTGVVGGVPGGVVGGIMGVPSAAPPPPPPAQLIAPKQLPLNASVIRSLEPGGRYIAQMEPSLRDLARTTDPKVIIEVQILLRTAAPSVMEALRQLGFEITQPAGAGLQLRGRIAAQKLNQLAQFDGVRYIVRVRKS